MRPRGIGANHAKGRGQHETETQRRQRLSIAGALGKSQTGPVMVFGKERRVLGKGVIWSNADFSFFFFLMNSFTTPCTGVSIDCSFLKNKFIYFGLHWVFVAACRLSLVAASGGYTSLWCVGFSLRCLLLLWSTGSRHTGFSSCGTQAQ